MRVRVQHITEYGYPAPVALGPQVIRLRPATHARARLLSYHLQIEPEGALRWQHDPWSNRIARLTFPAEKRYAALRFVVDASFDIRPVNPFDFYVDDRCRSMPFAYPEGLARELAPFLLPPTRSARLARFIDEEPLTGYVVDALVALNARVAKRVRYIIRNEPGVQTSEETLTRGAGSCRDSAVLLCDVLRAQGLAARFVSGYLVQLVDEGIIPDQAKGVSQDVVDLHAWAEVYLPGAGWIGMDGTSGLLCGEGHIPLAAATGPELAAPIVGTASAAAERFAFVLSVSRLGHEPRPRRPYDDRTWSAILSSGDLVDQALCASDIALTSGGEPTFTSRLHPRRPEWQTEALGETKREQGQRLARELAPTCGPGVLLLERQGKRYPGESLPRWALQLIWRADGLPIWRGLGPTGASAPAPEPAVIRRLCESLARRLGVEPRWLAAYEDPWHHVRLHEELPPDVDPYRPGESDDETRQRLARVLAQGLGAAVGWVLPLQQAQGLWRTGEWTCRRGRLYLLPGDSPIGLRLPLERIGGAWLETHEPDFTGDQGPLSFDPAHPGPRRREAESPRPGATGTFAGTAGQALGSPGIPHTALCLEPCGGALRVFLPPLADADAFLELVAAVEETGAEAGLSLRLEGYPPPKDPRLRSLTVTPDPGVLEVNLPPCASFREYLDWMEKVGAAANRSGLSTEKYQLDGREAGSGGGNHLTLGGPTPAASPFLCRPEILGGLLRYLQHHPSLSYLFTGLFVGPTSQAPRIDEARLDALEELDLALSQIRPGEVVPPWRIDRLLRHLLVDVSGNPHRTELSIDKLYAPEGPAGRQGLIELRAFEMPPHERMAAVQMLLVRALVARCAREPYQRPLIAWGTRLHDQYLLPHYLWRDLEDVLRDLTRCGLPLEAEWFRPFLDYRFPVLGQLEHEDLRLELRGALEPWPTLGEEPAGGLVSRYVDSSLERLQVRATGLWPDRHVVTVNGFELPLHPTGVAGEAVAGLRFRAWQPPHCLQPLIGVHHPLRFDLIDTWARRSLAGCQYHVWHPEGQAFNEPPLTAFEAAARRAQRFTIEGQHPGPATVKPGRPHPNHPITFDLRWAGREP